VTDFGDNTLTQPLEIIEARTAQHQASKTQRDHVDKVAGAHDDLANAEYAYRTALSDRWKELRGEGWAATVCGDIARGEEKIANLRKERDEAQGALRALEEDSYRIAADRRALDGLVRWSMHRDLRTDAPPLKFDPVTGEIRDPGLREVA